jgi:MOSC domain-containing protein YiiM
MERETKLVSVNVGLQRIVMNNGDPVSTGIFKAPVAERVILRKLNLDGDRQADLSVTVALAKRSTSIRPNTTTIGNKSCPA